MTSRWCKDLNNSVNNVDSDNSANVKNIECSTRVKVTVKEGHTTASISTKEDYRALGIYAKYDGKWHVADEKGRKQVWTPDIGSGNFLVLARIIKNDLSSVLWQDTDHTLSAWTIKSIYILVDDSGIDDVYEKIVLDDAD